MATTTTATTQKIAKAPKVEIPMGKRLDSQITRAVLAGKMTADELRSLAARLTRLHAFVSNAE